MIELGNILTTSTQQRVVILENESLSELFDSVHPMRLSVTETKRATKFAVEDGTERSDHVVTELVEIQIDLSITDNLRNSFENLRQTYLNDDLVTVQTKVASYPNMLIIDLPHDETAELGNAVNIAMRLQEWKAVKPEYGEVPPRKVEKKKQSSTVKRGQQTTTEPSPESQEKTNSVLYDIFN